MWLCMENIEIYAPSSGFTGRMLEFELVVVFQDSMFSKAFRTKHWMVKA